MLIVNSNFGCGSSREHAPQALAKWGIKAIVGVSYSEIFFGNCVAMGFPCLRVSVADSEAIQAVVTKDPSISVTVDVDKLEVRAGSQVHQPVTAPRTIQCTAKNANRHSGSGAGLSRT